MNKIFKNSITADNAAPNEAENVAEAFNVNLATAEYCESYVYDEESDEEDKTDYCAEQLEREKIHFKFILAQDYYRAALTDNQLNRAEAFLPRDYEDDYREIPD